MVSGLSTLKNNIGIFSAVFLLLILPACQSFNPLDLAKPQVELNANVGENVKQEKSQIKVEQGKTEQTAETISNDNAYKADTITQITEHIPSEVLFLLILFAGWVIPSPGETYRGMTSLVGGIWTALIVSPVRGFGNFLLKLLNRT